MESRIKLAGHPIHPMLVVLPLGLLSVAVVADVGYLLGGPSELADVAFWNIGFGIVGGLLAALFGLVDWLGIRAGSRAKRIGLWHGIGNVVIVALFAVSWLLRLDDHAYAPSLIPFLPALLGVALALVTAWLGGELVYRLRIGVDAIANDDAPSSLEGPVVQRRDRPARIG